jgi:hypothetical protein
MLLASEPIVALEAHFGYDIAVLRVTSAKVLGKRFLGMRPTYPAKSVLQIIQLEIGVPTVFRRAFSDKRRK